MIIRETNINNKMSVNDCYKGHTYKITAVNGDFSTIRFYESLGFIIGEELNVVIKTKAKTVVAIMSVRIALDRKAASLIQVEKKSVT